MKKPAAKRTPARKTKTKRAGPLDRFLSGEDVEMLRQMLTNALPNPQPSLDDRIEAFLSCDPANVDEMPETQAMMDLSEELERLRIDANGGAPKARKALNRARERIGEAAREDDIHPGILIILGRLFASAKVDVGEAARASMGRMVSEGLFQEPGEDGFRALMQPMLNGLAGDDFGLHEEIRCFSAIFPSAYKAGLVEAVASDFGDRARRCAPGFLLDPDEATALAAIRGLAASAARGELDAVTRRRIGLIRPWLPSARREALDLAFPPAAPAQEDAGARIAKATASACDGSGASSLIATVKRGARVDVVVLLANSRGIGDSTLIADAPKKKAQELQREVGRAMPAAETTVETWIRLVRLALGRNLVTNTPPLFELVRAIETIGLEQILPDCATPAETIESLLAGIADRDEEAAIRDARRAVADSDVAESWFEAGEDLEAVLQPTRTAAEGVRAMLEAYLPRRRDFWSSQCALTALALSAAPPPEGWRAFALVGRDLARNTPLTEIPLMARIAEKSVNAFFANRRRAGSS